MENQNIEDLLDEMKDTPDEFLKPVNPGFKPVEIDKEISASLSAGKENAGVEDKDTIQMPDGTETEAAGGTDDIEEDPEEGEDINLAELLPPDTVIDLMNLALVFIGVFFISKKFNLEIDESYYKFTTEEKATIKKPLARCLKATSAPTKNPWVSLIIVLVSILAVKSLTIWSIVKERREEMAANDGKPLDKINTVMEDTAPKAKRGRKKGGHNKVKTA